MKHRRLFTRAIVVALVLCTSTVFAAAPAADDVVSHKKPLSGEEKQAWEARQKEMKAKREAKAKIKRIDLNRAGKAELKKLPGITDELADKIVAGRPYGERADLVADKVMELGTYVAIKDQIGIFPPYPPARKAPNQGEAAKKSQAK